MNKKEILTAVFLVFILIVISGVEQCQQGIGGEKTKAAKYGVDFTLQPGLDRLTEGKVIMQGETFYVDILIENFDSKPKSGEICIRDDINEVYGGINDKCKTFNIPSATYIENKLESPASIRIIFPENDYYKYEGIPVDTDATLFVSISYLQHSIISGAVKAPEPQQETLTLQQTPSPVFVTVDKSVTSMTDNVKVNLKIGFTKQGEYNITSTDFKKEAIVVFPKLSVYNLDCPEIKQGLIEFRNTKFISCSAFLPREQYTHPLQLTLDYGVKLIKSFDFKIKKSE
ncbi:MAG: hypothetical protein QW041_01350 [Candidatus Pacearchaeota archaeon]